MSDGEKTSLGQVGTIAGFYGKPSVHGRSDSAESPKSIIGYDGCPWEVEIAPKFWIRQNHAPNWFHRQMQRWLLGLRWSSRKPLASSD